MKEIIPKRIQRSRADAAQPWDIIVKRFQELTLRNLRFEPMLKLVSTIAASPQAEELFARKSMHSVLITDTEEIRNNDNVLLVSYSPIMEKFEFEHRTLAGKDDKKKCEEAEALQTLSLFIKYKFGVLFNPKPANKTAR
jgi:hypothetical protein